MSFISRLWHRGEQVPVVPPSTPDVSPQPGFFSKVGGIISTTTVAAKDKVTGKSSAWQVKVRDAEGRLRAVHGNLVDICRLSARMTAHNTQVVGEDGRQGFLHSLTEDLTYEIMVVLCDRLLTRIQSWEPEQWKELTDCLLGETADHLEHFKATRVREGEHSDPDIPVGIGEFGDLCHPVVHADVEHWEDRGAAFLKDVTGDIIEDLLPTILSELPGYGFGNYSLMLARWAGSVVSPNTVRNFVEEGLKTMGDNLALQFRQFFSPDMIHMMLRNTLETMVEQSGQTSDDGSQQGGAQPAGPAGPVVPVAPALPVAGAIPWNFDAKKLGRSTVAFLEVAMPSMMSTTKAWHGRLQMIGVVDSLDEYLGGKLKSTLEENMGRYTLSDLFEMSLPLVTDQMEDQLAIIMYNNKLQLAREGLEKRLEERYHSVEERAAKLRWFDNALQQLRESFERNLANSRKQLNLNKKEKRPLAKASFDILRRRITEQASVSLTNLEALTGALLVDEAPLGDGADAALPEGDDDIDRRLTEIVATLDRHIVPVPEDKTLEELVNTYVLDQVYQVRGTIDKTVRSYTTEIVRSVALGIICAVRDFVVERHRRFQAWSLAGSKVRRGFFKVVDKVGRVAVFVFAVVLVPVYKILSWVTGFLIARAILGTIFGYIWRGMDEIYVSQARQAAVNIEKELVHPMHQNLVYRAMSAFSRLYFPQLRGDDITREDMDVRYDRYMVEDRLEKLRIEKKELSARHANLNSLYKSRGATYTPQEGRNMLEEIRVCSLRLLEIAREEKILAGYMKMDSSMLSVRRLPDKAREMFSKLSTAIDSVEECSVKHNAASTAWARVEPDWRRLIARGRRDEANTRYNSKYEEYERSRKELRDSLVRVDDVLCEIRQQSDEYQKIINQAQQVSVEVRKIRDLDDGSPEREVFTNFIHKVHVFEVRVTGIGTTYRGHCEELTRAMAEASRVCLRAERSLQEI